MNAAEQYGAKSEVTSVLKSEVLLLMSHETAYRMVQAAENLGERFNTVLNAGPKALYGLAAPSTLDSVRRGEMGGEYLDSLGKTDLETLNLDEWLTFVEAVVTGYCDHLRALAERDEQLLRRLDPQKVPF